jgi:beta-arrestin
VSDPSQKENLGIIVQYRVKVKLIVSMGGDLSVELPFTLTHPKPPPSPSTSRNDLTNLTNNTPNTGNSNNNASNKNACNTDQSVPIDLNLIQFDTK